MIEVLFSENEGLSMRNAKNYEMPDFRRGSVGYDKSQRKPTIKELEEMFAGKPVGGSKEDVVYIDMCLDVGDLSEPIDGEYRKNLFYELNSVYVMNSYANQESLDAIWKRCLKQLSRLNEYIKRGETFRIWYSNAPYSLCGFYYVCFLLKGCENQVTIIKLPENHTGSDNALPRVTSWNNVSAGKLYQFLALEKQLSQSELQSYAKEWSDLVNEKSELRVFENETLKGVPADYYDERIRKEIPDTKFKLGVLLGALLEKYQPGPDDNWYSGRILQMIEAGELFIVKKDKETFYSTILAKRQQ